MTKIVDTQYWLAELDVHGNPTLTDGAHDDTDGANEALYLYKRLGFYKEGTNEPCGRKLNRKYTVPALSFKGSGFYVNDKDKK